MNIPWLESKVKVAFNPAEISGHNLSDLLNRGEQVYKALAPGQREAVASVLVLWGTEIGAAEMIIFSNNRSNTIGSYRGKLDHLR